MNPSDHTVKALEELVEELRLTKRDFEGLESQDFIRGLEEARTEVGKALALARAEAVLRRPR